MVTKATSTKVEEVVEDAPAEEVKPDEFITPRDTVDALRLIRKNNLVEPGDDQDTRNHIRNIVVTWISQKRAGITNQDFNTWYSTPELNSDDKADEEDDPTAEG